MNCRDPARRQGDSRSHSADRFEGGKSRAGAPLVLFLGAYALLVVLVLLVRFYLVSWGLLLDAFSQAAMWRALQLHVGILAFTVAAAIILRLHPTGRGCTRLIIASTPVILLVGADRLLAVFVPPMSGTTTVFTTDPKLGWRHRPGVTGNWWGEVSINSKGLRGPDVPYDKPPGEFRLLFLGDSITFGLGI